MAHDHETKSRLIAKVLREILLVEAFDNLADLTDALKAQLSTLQIVATAEEISQAYAMVASNSEIAAKPKLEIVRRGHEQMPDTPTLNKSEAAAVYRQLLARFRAEQATSPMPGAPEHFPSLTMVR